MYVCVRFVNYRINDDGSYNTRAPGIETINVVAVVDISFPEWKIAKEFILECEGDNNDGSGTRSLWLEDVRVF
jgi:hypothetical protein